MPPWPPPRRAAGGRWGEGDGGRPARSLSCQIAGRASCQVAPTPPGSCLHHNPCQRPGDAVVRLHRSRALCLWSLSEVSRRSSGVEHTLGKGGVGSSILLGGTIFLSLIRLLRNQPICCLWPAAQSSHGSRPSGSRLARDPDAPYQGGRWGRQPVRHLACRRRLCRHSKLIGRYFASIRRAARQAFLSALSMLTPHCAPGSGRASTRPGSGRRRRSACRD